MTPEQANDIAARIQEIVDDFKDAIIPPPMKSSSSIKKELPSFGTDIDIAAAWKETKAELQKVIVKYE